MLIFHLPKFNNKNHFTKWEVSKIFLSKNENQPKTWVRYIKLRPSVNYTCTSCRLQWRIWYRQMGSLDKAHSLYILHILTTGGHVWVYETWGEVAGCGVAHQSTWTAMQLFLDDVQHAIGQPGCLWWVEWYLSWWFRGELWHGFWSLARVYIHTGSLSLYNRWEFSLLVVSGEVDFIKKVHGNLR